MRKLRVCVPPSGGASDELAAALADLRERPEIHLPRLFNVAGGYTPSTVAYFEHYGLDVPGTVHDFGAFDAGPYRLAAQVFRPRAPRGTIVALHGYLDHAGMLTPLVRRLAPQHAVALFDLPGHGLSTGERAAIGDFAEYAAALRAFVALCREHLPAPVHLVGHSTGGAVILDHVLTGESEGVGRVVLVAPLVRSYAWHVSRLGQSLAGLVVDHVPRVFRSNSSDADFLRFVKRDPLQPRRLPLSWPRALRRWLERIAPCPPSDREALVLQGDRDTTVDWRYNETFLRDKLPRVKVLVIEGGRHHLVNEARPLRDQVLDAVAEYVE